MTRTGARDGAASRSSAQAPPAASAFRGERPERAAEAAGGCLGGALDIVDLAAQNGRRHDIKAPLRIPRGKNSQRRTANIRRTVALLSIPGATIAPVARRSRRASPSQR